MKNKTILVTGGCGYIGTSFIASLLATRPTTAIRVLDNLETGTKADLAEITTFDCISPDKCTYHNGVSLVEGDIRDPRITALCSRNVDCIVHLAANTGVSPSVADPRRDMEYNVIGTFNMLEAARLNNIPRFIFASSGAPAGNVTPPIHEELPPHPVSPYGASKLAGEGYCSAYYRTFGIDTICLRFGNVYGPRSKKKSSVVAKFIRQALNGETCEIYGDGTQTRDFIYIDDLVRALVLSMEKDVGGETFQIATGMECTVGEVAGLIATALDKRGIKMRIEFGQPRLGDVERNFSDTTKARKMLGWQVDVDLRDGIEQTIDYFLKIEELEIS